MIKKALLFLLIPVAIFSGCKVRQSADNKPVVTVTILPLQYFVEQLAGDHFRVNVLIPPGVSHHNYDPTPRQLQEMETSKALFVNGQLGFETAWIPKIRSNYKDLPIIDLSTGVTLITSEGGEGEHGHDEAGESEGHEHEGAYPHYWMSVTEARKMASTMAGGLIQADPAFRATIEKNLDLLTRRLDSLGSAMSNRLQSLSHRSFLIFHPALTYLARDYQLKQYSMELGGKEPTASHFRDLVQLAHNEDIHTIFIQKEYDQENAQSLAREIQATIVVIDPMSPDWFSEMEQLAGKLAAMDEHK